MTVKTRRRESRRLECLTAAGRVFAYSQADKQQTRRIQYVASDRGAMSRSLAVRAAPRRAGDKPVSRFLESSPGPLSSSSQANTVYTSLTV